MDVLMAMMVLILVILSICWKTFFSYIPKRTEDQIARRQAAIRGVEKADRMIFLNTDDMVLQPMTQADFDKKFPNNADAVGVLHINGESHYKAKSKSEKESVK